MRVTEENPQLPAHGEKRKIKPVFSGLHGVSDRNWCASKQAGSVGKHWPPDVIFCPEMVGWNSNPCSTSSVCICHGHPNAGVCILKELKHQPEQQRLKLSNIQGSLPLSARSFILSSCSTPKRPKKYQQEPGKDKEEPIKRYGTT